MTIEQEVLSFYGYWQLSVCLFAFVALLAIWWHIGRKRKDFGQVWLAFSVLCWSLSGLIELYYTHSLLEDGTLADGLVAGRDGWRSILSLFNSLFILLALPWFRYIPKKINPIIRSKYWHFIIGLPFLFSLLPTLGKMVWNQSIGLISELDVLYAFLTLFFLGWVLFESFNRRRLPILSWLAVVCILLTLTAQLLKLSAQSVNLILFSAIFKTCLIMLFFALALSWVKDLIFPTVPISSELNLAIPKPGEGRDVILNGIPGREKIEISLSPMPLSLLRSFAVRRCESPDGWMEIKPKSRGISARKYDINDYNEIKRLLTALLDGIYGKDCWSKNLHEIPLKNALFEMSEKRERKIRLVLPRQNISLDIN